MDSQAIRMECLRIIGQCRRYKYILCCIGIIVVGYIGWGYIHQGDESEFNDHGEFQLPLQEQRETKGIPKNDGESHGNGTLVYDVGYALRGKPWTEVLLGDREAKQELSVKKGAPTKDKRSKGDELHPMLDGDSIPNDDSDSVLVTSDKRTRTTDGNDRPTKQKAFTGARATEKQSIQLVGIIEGPTSHAIITKGKSPKSMAQGDKWDGILVLTVDTDRVQIEEGGQRRWITVGN